MISICMCPCDDVGYALTDNSVSLHSVTRLVLVISKMTHRRKYITTSKIEYLLHLTSRLVEPLAPVGVEGLQRTLLAFNRKYNFVCLG